MIELPALDRLPVPLFRARRDATLTWVNDAWTAALGVPAGELWHHPFEAIDDEQGEALWTRTVEQGIPTELSSPARVGEGHIRFYDLVLQPAKVDGHDELMGSLGDITEQTVALSETQAILDTAVDGIIIIDTGGRIETFNQAAADIFGYSPESIIGQSINRLMMPAEAARHDGYLSRYLKTGEAAIIGVGRELVGRRADGTPVPIYLAISEIALHGRRRFAGIVRDLTEQQAAREALASQREKLAHVGRLSTMGEMTASIAHEINQPLTAISMYAQASLKLLERSGDLDKVKDALDKLNTQSLRAGAVIERIQRFARTQETTRSLQNINTLLRDLLKLADSDARMHDIELVLSLDENLPDVLVDPVQIQQVMLNLIRNGIDAMNEIGCRNGRTIRLATDWRGDRVCVRVSDQGPGVAEDQAKLLFTPFHTTKKEGMGMGLSICRSIMIEHGGELNFENNPDTGATFYFTLPVDDD